MATGSPRLVNRPNMKLSDPDLFGYAYCNITPPLNGPDSLYVLQSKNLHDHNTYKPR